MEDYCEPDRSVVLNNHGDLTRRVSRLMFRRSESLGRGGSGGG